MRKVMDQINSEADNPQSVWIQVKADIRERFERIMGPMPARVPVHAQFGEAVTDSENGVRRIRLKYESWDGDEVTAYLLLPPAFRETLRYPAVLALHQTAVYGKDEAVGLDGDRELAYGRELAARGFVVLAPDELTAGERIFAGQQAFCSAPFEARYPEWSMIGKMMYDHQLGLDLLESLPYVDAGRFGVIGHSLGGYNAFILAAFDERIRAAVSSCGLSTFDGDATPQRWGLRKEWFTHLPLVSEYLARNEIPFEFHELAAAIAPRAYFNWSTQHDDIFPHWPSIAAGLADVHDVYAWLGAEEGQFVSLVGNGRHAFPARIRSLAYDWLHERLKR